MRKINPAKKEIKILVFTEGTIIMHKSAVGHSRDEIVKQAGKEQKPIHDYKSYVPIGKAAKKLKAWKNQDAEIFYLTSRKKKEEVGQIKRVLKRHSFPKGYLLCRIGNENYGHVVESTVPDILIEDDCESIGGADEMTITHIKPEIKKKIKSITVKEFEGIDYLPDNIEDMLKPIQSPRS